MDFTQRSDVEKKQDLTTAETCCSMESSASRVTPRVFTTLENGMDASPTERQSTGTVFFFFFFFFLMMFH